MSRLSILIERPRRTIGVLAAVLASVGVAVGASADFTAQTANPSNTFAAGTLTQSNSKDNAAIFTPSNMKPGGAAQTGQVDIENSGSLEGTFTLSRSALTNSDGANPLAQKINLVVVDCGSFASGTPVCEGGDPKVYDGTLSAFNGTAALGTYAAGEKHRYEFQAALDSSAGNQHQGDTAEATFQWDSVQ
jgi:spore coat-associated protein N